MTKSCPLKWRGICTEEYRAAGCANCPAAATTFFMTRVRWKACWRNWRMLTAPVSWACTQIHKDGAIMPKTVFITGTSSGIGLAATRYFASRGWNVVSTMLDMARGKELSGNTPLVRLDCSRPARHWRDDGRGHLHAAHDLALLRG